MFWHGFGRQGFVPVITLYRWSNNYSTNNLRLSQQYPWNPGGHMHIKLPEFVAWHVPPLKHGFGAHGLRGVGGGAVVNALPWYTQKKFMSLNTNKIEL